MKRLLFSFLFCIHTTALPQVPTYLNVTCFTLKQLAEVLTEFKEIPFAIGTVIRGDSGGVDENNVLLFVNQSTGSWTIAEKHKSGLYCVLSGGSNFTLIEKVKSL